MIVGVLAVQGDFPEHRRAFARLLPRENVRFVRRPEELEDVDVLLLPGGESTAIAKLLEHSGLWSPLDRRLEEGIPVLAPCAGLILLAKTLQDSAAGRDPPTFGRIDVSVRRNDYGGQRESFEGPVTVEGLTGEPFHGVFIRAPRIAAVGPSATPIAWRGDEVVGVRDGNAWGFTFHPELSHDSRLLDMFLAFSQRGLAQKRKKRTSVRANKATPTTTRSQ
jgi:5'-phosphate synthase pdxT subunit